MLNGRCWDDKDCEEGKMVVAGNGEKEAPLILNCRQVGQFSNTLKCDSDLFSKVKLSNLPKMCNM